MNKRVLISILSILVLFSCKTKTKAPDISKIILPITAMRFDQDFFSLDSNKLTQGLSILQKKYGSFYDDFLYNILAIPSNNDQEKTLLGIKEFLKENRKVFQDVQSILSNTSTQVQQIQSGLKRAKYYFPLLPIPDKIVFFVGPLDSYNCLITKEVIAIGLQHYLEPTYIGYQTTYLQNLFPPVVIRKFSKRYMAADVLNMWLQGSFPVKMGKQTLADRIIEEGKRTYLLEKLLPNTPDTVITGFTEDQLKWCAEHRAEVWQYFIKNKLLQSDKPEIILQYTSDQALPEEGSNEFPPNIGRFLGLKIVDSWMGSHRSETLMELMDRPNSMLAETKSDF